MIQNVSEILQLIPAFNTDVPELVGRAFE